jgi:hypothetical protein
MRTERWCVAAGIVVSANILRRAEKRVLPLVDRRPPALIAVVEKKYQGW